MESISFWDKAGIQDSKLRLLQYLGYLLSYHLNKPNLYQLSKLIYDHRRLLRLLHFIKYFHKLHQLITANNSDCKQSSTIQMYQCGQQLEMEEESEDQIQLDNRTNNNRRTQRMFRQQSVFYDYEPSLTPIDQFSLFNKIYLITSYSCKSLFYLLDNIRVLINFSVFYDYEDKILDRSLKFYSFVLLGLSYLNKLMAQCFELRILYQKEQDLKVQVIDQVDLKQFLKELKRLAQQRFRLKVDIVATIGDIVVTANKIKLTSKILGINLNYGFVAYSGLFSCLIQLYRRLKDNQTYILLSN